MNRIQTLAEKLAAAEDVLQAAQSEHAKALQSKEAAEVGTTNLSAACALLQEHNILTKVPVSIAAEWHVVNVLLEICRPR